MTSNYNSPQEEFWANEFGDSYITRNQSAGLFTANAVLFAEILNSIDVVPRTFLELGANIGMNIKAIQSFLPDAEFTGIEINKVAAKELAKLRCNVIESSILETKIQSKFDFVFSKGVLIHLSPDQLPATYKKMYEWSDRFILIAEYYNPSPVAIPYRGNTDRLFKRDFAGELMDLFPDLILRDYGFAYHRDKYPQDDISWFLLEKCNPGC
jgi:pseudaminic acid biosynthesis-associated methylase